MRKLISIHESWLAFLKRDAGSCLFFFLLGLVLRAVPELLVSWYPVGYETITYYAPSMISYSQQSLAQVFANSFQNRPLFYVLMWLISSASKAHPYTILKYTGPMLYGGLAAAFFLFLKRGLKVEWKIAFLSTLLCVFQIAALRESWDRFRTVLALIFLFISLVSLRSRSKFKWIFVTFFSLLTILTREYVAFALFVTVLGSTILERKDRLLSLLSLTPAFSVFVFLARPSNILWDYTSVGQFLFEGYLWTIQDTLLIFSICYLPIIFFLVKGFWRNTLLDPLVAWLLVGSFSATVIPWFAVPGYQRWEMLLVFPFSIYAAKGFERVGLLARQRRHVLIIVVLSLLIVGAGYSTGAFSYVGLLPNSYVPINLVQSSIDFKYTSDVIQCLQWLDLNAVPNSVVLAEERFYGWTQIYFTRSNTDVTVIVYGPNSLPHSALEKAVNYGFQSIYLIWFATPSLQNFNAIHTQNSISMFQYTEPIST